MDAAVAWRTSLRLYAFIAVAGVALGGATIARCSGSWFPGVSYLLLVTALAIFPVSLMLAFILSIFQGRQEFREFNLISIVQPALTLLCVSFLVVFNARGIHWLLLAYLSASVVTTAVALYMLKPYTRKAARKFSSYGAASVKSGYKVHLSNVLAFVNYRSDIFLVNIFLGPASTGIYVISVQIVERLWILSQAVVQCFCLVSPNYSGEEEKRKILTPLISRWVLLGYDAQEQQVSG
ncbi:MAG: oligosaccharide flippase family protein [Halioglobus sp.]|nr:oligosaccharide flippase family protein [Halioglobus sp.]